MVDTIQGVTELVEAVQIPRYSGCSRAAGLYCGEGVLKADHVILFNSVGEVRQHQDVPQSQGYGSYVDD
jgi:hypothetical protein